MKTKILYSVALVLLIALVARATFFRGFQYSFPLEGLKRPVSVSALSYVYLQIALTVGSIVVNLVLIKLILSAKLREIKGDNYFLLLLLIILLFFLVGVLVGISQNKLMKGKEFSKVSSKEPESRKQTQGQTSYRGETQEHQHSEEATRGTEGKFVISEEQVPASLASLLNTLMLVSSATLFVMLALMAFKLIFAKKGKEITFTQPTFQQKAEEALAIVDKSIDYILKSGDFREAVVYYYLEMCKLMKKYGARIKDSWTAREVERALIETFPEIPEKPLSVLTYLFEYARYSHYPVLEHHKNEALECLQSIKEYLSSVSPQEG